MKKILFISIAFIILCAAKTDTLRTIVTSKEDALINKKYKKFIVIDEATQWVLSKNPVKFDFAKKMPVHYFTTPIPGKLRFFGVHSLNIDPGMDDYDWVLTNNKTEQKIFYSRSKFIVEKASMSWIFVVRGERILMKNAATGNYLKITEDGKFEIAADENSASKWKFIHVY